MGVCFNPSFSFSEIESLMNSSNLPSNSSNLPSNSSNLPSNSSNLPSNSNNLPSNSNNLPSNSNNLPSNSNRSIESSLLSIQLHIIKNHTAQIQSSYREAESLLIEAYREILSVPQERRLQIQMQQLYTMSLLAKLGDRSRGSALIMTHLRNIPKGRSDSLVDHIGLLRVRQSVYWKLEEN